VFRTNPPSEGIVVPLIILLAAETVQKYTLSATNKNYWLLKVVKKE
jgi:hypothetical protein